jgi:hypothetical protein
MKLEISVLSMRMNYSHFIGATGVEALSCGRDRVRWPVPLPGLNMAGQR